MSAQKDYYKILGVNNKASAEEIKQKFVALSKELHPDLPKVKKKSEQERKEISAKYSEITEAYDILRNPEKRRQYDQMQSNPFAAGFQQGGFSGEWFNNSNFNFDFNSSENFNINDLFGEIFGFGGGNRSRGKKSRGADINLAINITLAEAYSGKSMNIMYERMNRCTTCNGNGSTSPLQPCSACRGSGMEVGIFGMMTPCRKCNGAKQVIADKDKCKKCNGNGLVREDITMTVNVPRGIAHNTRLMYEKQGSAGINGVSGDLFITVEIKSNSIFTRKDDDLYCTFSASVGHMTLGGKCEIQDLTGAKITVDIPPATQHGTKIKISSKGMPKKYGFGDLYVTILTKIPQIKHASAEVKNAWQIIYDHENKQN